MLDDPAEAEKPGALKKFFYTEFINGVTRNLVEVKTRNDEYKKLTADILDEITKFFILELKLARKDTANSEGE